MKGLGGALPLLLILPALSPAADPKTSALADFGAICARCHNTDGSGAPQMGIPSFIDPQWQGSQTDAQLRDAIVHGRDNKMPPFGTAFPPAEIDALVKYVRGFAPKASGKPKPPG